MNKKMSDNISIHNVNNQLILNSHVRSWCELPYPNHPKGCPNYNKKPECPPNAPLINNFINLNKSIWFISIKFNIENHANQMKEKHPHWTKKQCRCVLYWQNTVRKNLKDSCILFCKNTQRIFTLIPEAMGVYVIKTAKRIGIPIRTKPKDIIFKIALIGYPKNPKKTLINYL